MSTYFFTDPHLGAVRNSHTTESSRTRLRQRVYEQVLGGIEATRLADPKARFICLGDLFDEWTNDELIIQQGLEIVSLCDYVMAGNHDVPNREGELSSFDLVARVAGTGNAVMVSPFRPDFLVDADVAFVPHQMLNSEFLSTFEAVFRIYVEHGKSGLICFHGNYASPFVRNDSTLNLPKETVLRLRELVPDIRGPYPLIVGGHEHNFKHDPDTGVLMLGNTFPLGFGDISDKFFWEWDGAKMTPHPVWRVEQGYAAVPWEELLDTVDFSSQAEFIDIKGEAPADRIPEIARRVVKLWGKCENALMIRNGVVVADKTKVQVSMFAIDRFVDIPTRVTNELAGTSLQPLWEKYLNAAKETPG